MRFLRLARWRFLILGLICIFIFGLSPAQESGNSESSGLSRQMQAAIRFYQQGKDTEAMDRFMDILVRGDPGERPMANDYLNRITQRFAPSASGFKSESALGSPHRGSVGGRTLFGPGRSIPVKKPAVRLGVSPKAKPVQEFTPPKMTPSIPKDEQEPTPKIEEPASTKTTRTSESIDEREAVPAEKIPAPEKSEVPEIDKEQMKREIEEALSKVARFYESQLKGVGGIRIVMADSNRPRAVAVPTHLLFESGVVFSRRAKDVIKGLTGIIFAVGGAQISMLPEGAVSGDSKVLDMRRAVAVSAQIYAAGVAPSRLRVNLLQSQMDIPKELSEFHGLILSFAYDRKRNLSAEHAPVDDSGPPISLGVFPDRLWPEKKEGVIIEFSIMETAAKLMSWKFQLLRPGHEPGDDMNALVELSGDTPVFHQYYWNGHQNYFGELLPPGRYQAALTATDAKGQTRTLRAWIQSLGQGYTPSMESSQEASEMLRSLEPEKPARRSSAAPKIELPKVQSRSQASAPKPAVRAPAPDQAVSRGSPTSDTPGGTAESPAKKSNASPAGSQTTSAQAAVSYKIGFNVDTENMTQEGERRLSQVVDTQNFYPMEKLNLVGYASADEPNPESLAQNRAKKIVSLLVTKYNINPNKIQAQFKVVRSPTYEVEVYIVSGKE